jgi:ATP-dependent DNA helicase DinG
MLFNMPKHDLLQYFPFATIRSQQQEAIEFAINAFESGKRFVVLELGTGVGKSATGVCISRYLRSHSSADPAYGLGSWFLTTQKILQQQYIRDFGGPRPTDMKTIKSSTSFCCQMHDDSEECDKLTCGEIHRLMNANQIFKMLYKTCVTKCRYKQEKSVWMEALESCTNYAYFFAESQYAKQIQPRELLVLDEAHTIEEQLSSFVEISISERFAQQHLDVKMPRSFANMTVAVSWIRSKYLKSLRKKVEEMGKMLEDMTDAAKKIKSFQDFAQRHDLLDKHMCKVNRFLKSYREENWVMNEVSPQGKSMRKLEFKPVDVSEFSHDHLFNFGKHVLLMSATILDKDVFCRSLGIDISQTEFLRIGSPFDVSNRPIHILPVASMSKARIDESLPTMVEAVKFIVDQHKNEKGIIHCVNFKIAQYLIEHCADPRLVTHDSTNRDMILKMHEESPQPSVLVSPSMMEGVDLADDKSRFQILCKVPFPYLGDKVIQKRMQRDSRWYDYKTVMMTIQAFGRSVRNEDDHAISYVIDSDWERFFRKTKSMFPDEFIQAIR